MELAVPGRRQDPPRPERPTPHNRRGPNPLEAGRNSRQTRIVRTKFNRLERRRLKVLVGRRAADPPEASTEWGERMNAGIVPAYQGPRASARESERRADAPVL